MHSQKFNKDISAFYVVPFTALSPIRYCLPTVFLVGEDYDVLKMFESGETRMCTVAYIMDDDTLEESPEYFEVVLSVIFMDRVSINPSRTRVQIFDNDRELGRVSYKTLGHKRK